MSETKDFLQNIIIQGARVHNLKNIDVRIPRNRLVVITGVSGSGKSSLAFDTLFAEGQRRYVESLSSYARQFLGRMSKPDVDNIIGIAPAIAVEQKVNTRNPRSTVGTSTEIYEYIKLLYARIGKTYSPVSGNLVRRHTVSDVTDYIMSLDPSTRVMLYTPLIVRADRSLSEHLNVLMQQGFTRLLIHNEIVRIDEMNDKHLDAAEKENVHILIDRLSVDTADPMLAARLADSAQTAFYEGNGICIVEHFVRQSSIIKEFNHRFESDGIEFEEPSVNLFSFNNPYGACKTCEGFGTVIGIDPDLVIPNKGLSIYEEAIACFKGEKMGEWNSKLLYHASKYNIPIHKPVSQFSPEQLKLIWDGTIDFQGINDFFRMVEENAYKIQYRVLMARYRGKTTCPQCNGSRLRKEASWVKVGGKPITEIAIMPASDALQFFNNIQLSETDSRIASRLLKEIINRLTYLNDVGLGYLSLNRLSNSLSGGESQRINLSTSLGSNLTGSMYILDEPSIGLHSRDTKRLIGILKRLRDAGNSVIVVEHDEEIMRAADYLIDMGPDAGNGGGQVVFQGTLPELLSSGNSYTASYLNKSLSLARTSPLRKWKDYILINGARENNLRSINVKFPLGIMTCVTGVSGSGKTSLVKNILYAGLRRMLGGHSERVGLHDSISGDINLLSSVELIDQNPIGRSTRSNPVTYIKAWDEVRSLFASQKLSQMRGYKPGMFSFNIQGGRCEVCQGEGVVHIEMQFMADIILTCENCNGQRFTDEVLDINFREKNVADLLNMTVDEAVDFFRETPQPPSTVVRVIERLQTLQEVGLGYIKLGQSSSTLSGGEAQRVKLAFYLIHGSAPKPILFIFDEPTTGLHFHDIKKLLKSFNALINNGHTVIVIEHNTEIMRNSDWVIDLGPEGGNEGGNIVFEGSPTELPNCSSSYTGRFLLAE